VVEKTDFGFLPAFNPRETEEVAEVIISERYYTLRQSFNVAQNFRYVPVSFINAQQPSEREVRSVTVNDMFLGTPTIVVDRAFTVACREGETLTGKFVKHVVSFKGFAITPS
jgi:hypothetical protein